MAQGWVRVVGGGVPSCRGAACCCIAPRGSATPRARWPWRAARSGAHSAPAPAASRPPRSAGRKRRRGGGSAAHAMSAAEAVAADPSLQHSAPSVSTRSCVQRATLSASGCAHLAWCRPATARRCPSRPPSPTVSAARAERSRVVASRCRPSSESQTTSRRRTCRSRAGRARPPSPGSSAAPPTDNPPTSATPTFSLNEEAQAEKKPSSG